jgi:hypothetical protein
MIRVYARENATQRGNTSAALAGSVASAVKFIAKAIIINDSSAQRFLSRRDLGDLRARLVAKNGGVGQTAVVAFLKDTPGINDGVVQQQLANLKTSGEYARIMKEVRKEVVEETDDAEVIALAKAAEDAASGKEKTFDFEGVSKQLKNDNQVKAFRDWATAPGVAPHLDVNDQKKVAKRLVEAAKEQDVELSGSFIRQNASDMLTEAKVKEKRISKEEESSARERNAQTKLDFYQENFERNWRGTASMALKIAELLDSNKSLGFKFRSSFMSALRDARLTLDKLEKVMGRLT